MDTCDILADRCKGLLWGLFVCLLITSLAGCRTVHEVEVLERIVARTDTVRMVARDSVLVKDSVFVAQYAQGDTLYIVKDRWRTRERLRVDTVFRSKADTVVVRDSVRVSQPTVSRRERLLANVGSWACGAVVCFILLALAKRYTGFSS